MHASDDKLRNRYRTELKWIKRGAKARSTKQKARIGRFEELAEQVKKEDTAWRNGCCTENNTSRSESH